PDINLLFVDTIIAFDHIKGSVKVISNAKGIEDTDKSYDEAVDKIERVVARLREGNNLECTGISKYCSCPDVTSGLNLTSIKSNFTEEGFCKIVKKAKEYIASGDIFQANLSQRFSVPCSLDPFILYKALRSINPSPFAAYLDLGDLQIVSSSPERLLKLEGRDVQTRPIAGTRPRGKTDEEDRRLSNELILNEKERAEHIMLVDLERNDLGRVCEYGSVLVDEFLVLEEYSHVFHIVSNVVGKMRHGMDCFDLLRAGFPGGTITGCPKVRCMEIIDELEPVTRNIYTGSIGYLSFNGDMDLNIVIRTLILTKGIGYLQVGAGIVADSDPVREYYETLYKAEALFKAVDIVGGYDKL
ncbi:MAG: anthranilate synthase component I family protein, partial [Candidatus Omnitrophica bacterium]|nr:anthranilate synthase component I family protein [Candidatus Omnitrophota bacterium]